MPVAGECSRFAVEYELNGDYGGDWMFGRCSYWCAGWRLGDYTLGTSLRDVLFQLDQLAHYGFRRANRRFSAMDAPSVFKLLDGALFGAGDPLTAQVAEEEQWIRHNIVPPVDVFDAWKAFLVEDERSARIIFAASPYDEVTELQLLPGEVDLVLDSVRHTLGGIHEREKAGPGMH